MSKTICLTCVRRNKQMKCRTIAAKERNALIRTLLEFKFNLAYLALIFADKYEQELVFCRPKPSVFLHRLSRTVKAIAVLDYCRHLML